MRANCVQIFSLLYRMKDTLVKDTSIKVSLDTRRAKKDGTYPIILRLTHKRKTTSIKTGFAVKQEDWDEDKCEVRKSYRGIKSVTRLNNEIEKKKAEALDTLLQLEAKEKKAHLSLTDVKGKIDPSSKISSFYTFADNHVAELYKANRIGTAESYKGAIKFLRTFNKGKPLEKNKGGNPKTSKFKSELSVDLTFEEIDFSFLTRLENYHLGLGHELNGLAVYMRGIRAIYNQAIKAGVAEKSWYPFSDYKIKTKPTRKRAVQDLYVAKIIALDLPQDHPAFDARNYFVASYMMYGMNFKDMARLQKSDIVNARIQYQRSKTSKLYDILVTESLAGILSHYMQQVPTSKYIFPIIRREGAILQQRDIVGARKKYNDNLKTIAEMCGIQQNLTSYVSRHSFATNAMLLNIPVTAISEMLGHSSLKTTQIYLSSLPTNVLDEYNSQILKLKT